MKIRVLGCSGAEFPGHNPPGFLLDDKILFDAGSITNVLNQKEQFGLRHIFITHAHLDHIRGIPFLADNIVVNDKSHSVNVISIPPITKTIQKHLLNSSMWPDFTIIPDPCNAVLTLVEARAGRSLEIDNYTITPFKVNHSVPAVGYLVEDIKKRRFFYTGDTGPADRTWKEIGKRQIHCLIIEVSFPNLMKEIAITTGHLTPDLMKEELPKLNHMPEMIYIVHTKPQFRGVIKRELESLKIKNLRLLQEGEKITI